MASDQIAVNMKNLETKVNIVPDKNEAHDWNAAPEQNEAPDQNSVPKTITAPGRNMVPKTTMAPDHNSELYFNVEPKSNVTSDLNRLSIETIRRLTGMWCPIRTLTLYTVIK